MDMTGLGSVVGITAICYVIGMIAKAIQKIPDRWIPVIVGVSGAVLGLIGRQVLADFPAQDWMNALAVGIASGMASTGANQISKQLGGGAA